ncbi:MAG: hypothetical protein ACK5P5_14695 [Pseudobdellovibrionaceae bacterium]|jgi:hypothetical protein
MKLSLFAFVFLLSSSVFAASYVYQCDLVDDFDDWRVYVNLESDEASFFDNDTDSAGTLSHVVESLPSWYVFNSTKKDDWSFEMQDLENEEGYLPGVLYLKGAENKVERLEMNCYELQDDQD